MAAMIISCQLFEAYLFCPLKCWLRSRAEPVTGNKYAEWTRAHKEAYYKEGLKRAVAAFAESARAINPPIISDNFKDATWRFATDVRLWTHDLESRLLAVEKVPSEGRGRPIQLIPYHFAFENPTPFSTVFGQMMKTAKSGFGQNFSTSFRPFPIRALCITAATRRSF